MSNPQNSLFNSTIQHAPLPDRMRPRTLHEFIGQNHIIGEGRLLRRAIQADRLSSVIFAGPPGTGKTTLARVIANTTKRSFISLNAVLGGVAEVRKAIEAANEARQLYDRSTILFVDEVHRWNKTQQDALLPWVENGTVVFIGATTENPYFAVNSALVSRSRIFQLKPLCEQELRNVVTQALADPIRGYGKLKIEIEPAAIDHLIAVADGDARTLLGALELAVETTPDQFPPPHEQPMYISLQAAEDSIQRKAVLYDREGDYHYDTISAFIKSIRGSDPDAALYWMSRMVYSGEDPRYIFRRMLISACEDIGLADPHALQIVQAASQAFERVGMPEGQYFLSHAVLYLATAPKSNSSLGYFDALKAVEQEAQFDVPNHLKDDNRDKHGFGHGKGYAYPHAYREHWVAQEYLPSGLKGKIFYQPGKLGYEGHIYDTVNRRRELQLAVHTTESFPEVLSYSPDNARREIWVQRLLKSGADHIVEMRDTIFTLLKPARHHRILVTGQYCAMLTGEALRACPEGGITAAPLTRDEKDFLTHICENLPEEDRPAILSLPDKPHHLQLQSAPHSIDGCIAVNLLLHQTDRKAALIELKGPCETGARAIFAETYPAGGTRLSELLSQDFNDKHSAIHSALTAAEETAYHDPADIRTAWLPEDLITAAQEAGWQKIHMNSTALYEPRIIDINSIDTWLGMSDSQGTQSRFASHLQNHASMAEIELLRTELIRTINRKTVTWRINMLFITAQA